MATPKKKRTKSSAGKRQAHDGLEEVALNSCPQCGSPVKPHRVCQNCGTYKGKEKVKIKTKAEKSS